MSKRLTRAQRENIIINYLNKKETPGYQVIEGLNGKFTVRAIKEEPQPIEQPPKPKFEIEEEEINEQEAPRASHANDNIEKTKCDERSEEPYRTKQDARELLRQLSQLLNEEDEPQQQKQGQFIEKRYNPGPQSWKRKKLVF